MNPGRWVPQIEDALASGVPDRIGVAWAIIMETGGQRGCQTKAARVWGVHRARVSEALSGAAPISDAILAGIGRTSNIRPDVLWSGCHPFAIRPPFNDTEPLEPGDVAWEAQWAMLRMSFATLRSVSELRDRHPSIFP